MPPPHPHDAFFRALLSDAKWADALIRHCLHPDIATLLPDETFAAVEGSFVDDELRTTHADGVFSIRLTDGRMLFVLLEHKSTSDVGTPLQIAEYMLRIWRNHERSEGGVPLIIPIVYHGLNPRTRSTTGSSTSPGRRIPSSRPMMACAAGSGS